MKYLSTLCVLSIFLVSCSCLKKDTNSEFYGTWELIEKSGGFAGTKTNENLDEKIIINSKKIIVYKKEQKITEAPFGIEKSKVIESSEFQDVLKTENITKKSIKIVNGKLILTDQCYDCYVYVYKKTK